MYKLEQAAGIGHSGSVITPTSLQVVSTASSTRILIVLAAVVGPAIVSIIGEAVPVPMVIPVPVSITL